MGGKICGRKGPQWNWGYYPITCLRGLRRTKWNFTQGDRRPIQDSNLTRPEYKPEELMLEPTCAVSELRRLYTIQSTVYCNQTKQMNYRRYSHWLPSRLSAQIKPAWLHAPRFLTALATSGFIGSIDNSHVSWVLHRHLSRPSLLPLLYKRFLNKGRSFTHQGIGSNG
jgi:hypothetical protein